MTSNLNGVKVDSTKGGDDLYQYAKLKGRITEKFGSQKGFAEELGMTEANMSLKLNGKTNISKEEILRWCEVLDIQTSEIGEYFFA